MSDKPGRACPDHRVALAETEADSRWDQAEETIGPSRRDFLPEELPPHPRVFVTQADLKRSRELVEADTWARVALRRLLDAADAPFELPDTLREPADPERNWQILTQAKRQILAFHLTGKEAYYDRALTTFRRIAEAYLKWPLSDDHTRAMRDGLAESRFTIYLARVYDLLAGAGIEGADRDCFLEVLDRTRETTNRCRHKTCGNHNTWNLVARLAAGLARGQLADLHDALYGWEFEDFRRYGLVHQLRHDILADGLHWERTPGYHFYTLMALTEAASMLEHAGMDLWHKELPCQQQSDGDDLHRAYGPEGKKCLKAAYDAPFYLIFGNGDLSLVHDSGLVNIRGVWIWGIMYELAYQVYGDPKYAWLLQRIEREYRGWPERKYPALPMSLEASNGEFDFVRIRQAEVPEGRFSLAEDCAVSLTGRHERGCTLFPVTGITVLRNNPGDVRGAAAYVFWGPHSAGHQSPAALHLDLYARGQRLTSTPISGGYNDALHLTWVRTTIAHNTVTVDENPMFPYDRDSDSIWEADSRRERVSDGVLELFQPGEAFQACRAANEQVYPGVRLDRTIVLTEHFLIDLFRVISSERHRYDYAMHILGTLQLPDEARPTRLGEHRGYRHFREANALHADGNEIALAWETAAGITAGRLLLPDNATIVVAMDPLPETGGEDHGSLGALAPDPPRANVIVRAESDKAIFLSLWQFSGSDTQWVIESGQPDGDVVLQTRATGSAARWLLPWKPEQVICER